MLDQSKLAERVGVILSGREMLAAARDFEAEVGHDNLTAMLPARVELAFAAYLRKWIKRFQRKTLAIKV